MREDRDMDDHDVCTLDELRAILPKGVASDDSKVVYALDEHCRRFIELSPFVIIGSRNAAGAMDVYLTLRVIGKASVTSDPTQLETMSVQDRSPLAARRVAVEEAFIHCGKAPKRAHLWDTDARVEPGTTQLGDLTDADYEHNVY